MKQICATTLALISFVAILVGIPSVAQATTQPYHSAGLAAASCTTGKTLAGVRSNRYNIVTRGINLNRVHHFRWEVYSGNGNRVYRSSNRQQIIWRAPRDVKVAQVRGMFFYTSSERTAYTNCGWSIGVRRV